MVRGLELWTAVHHRGGLPLHPASIERFATSQMTSSTVTLISAGSNTRGQLSTGDLDDSHTFRYSTSSDFPPASSERILSVSSGANHTLVLLHVRDDSGGLMAEVWGCGDGRRGQLGPFAYLNCAGASDGSITRFQRIDVALDKHGLEGYIFRSVAASWETTYLVLSSPGNSDILLSMGSNDYGDLGVGDRKTQEETSSHFQQVNFNSLLGHVSEKDKLCIESLATGLHHVLVRLKVTHGDGSTYELLAGWGASRHGQLGKVNDPFGRAVPFVWTPRLVDTDPTLGRVVSASLGNQHTVLLHESGRVSGLGSNRKGQLQGLSDWRNVQIVRCTWNGTYAVTGCGDETHIVATGDHAKGQLGSLMPSDTTSAKDNSLAFVQFPFTVAAHQILDMACGSEHVLCLLQVFSPGSPDGRTEVWGWGWNEHGNLGIGSTVDVAVPTNIYPTLLNSESVTDQKSVAIWAGCATSWIALEP